MNPQSQRLLVKAVTGAGTELPECFRGKKELVLKVLTAILHPQRAAGLECVQLAPGYRG